MRSIIFILGTLCGSLSWGFPQPFTSGTYQGTGALTVLSSGANISYNVSTTIDTVAGTFATSYVYSTGMQYSLNFQLTDGSYGMFTLTANGTAAGSGFCIGSVCNIDVNYTDPTLGPLQTSISYTISGNTITGTGRNYTSGTIYQQTTSLVPGSSKK